MILKKLIAVIFACVLLLCGCENGVSDKLMLPSCFTADAKIGFDGTEYGLTLTRYSDSNWVVEFTAPETVKGLIFTVEDGDTSISFKGLHFTFDSEKFPVGAVMSMFYKSYDRLCPLEHDMVVGEKNDFVTGEVDDMTYTMTVDKNGCPLTLDLGDSGMSVEFENFEICEVTE